MRTKFSVKKSKRTIFKSFASNKALYGMLAPGLIMMLMFNYLPMFGLVLAFKKINFRQSIFLSPWNGLDNFRFMTQSQSLFLAIKNTLAYNAVFIIAGMLMAIGLAILLDLVRQKLSKKLYQTVMIMPHFLSWVIISYLVFGFLSLETGILNNSILPKLGIDAVNWYQEPKVWPAILIICYFWKDWGYSSIIYSSALTGVDTTLYEAADIDGATIWQKIINITIPTIRPLIAMMLILKMGNILSTDMGLFYQVPLNTPQLYSTTNVVSTFTYNLMRDAGASSMGMASAASLVQSVVGFMLVIGSNKLVSMLDSDGKGVL